MVDRNLSGSDVEQFTFKSPWLQHTPRARSLPVYLAQVLKRRYLTTALNAHRDLEVIGSTSSLTPWSRDR